jgi:two-component system sensor histidine kinase KdpD
MMQSVFKIQYLKAAFLSVLMPLVVVLTIFPFRELFTTTDIVMLQLLWVTWVAVRSNRRVAALTTLVSVACTDWFYVVPYFTFHIENIEYVVTFLVMLIVGLVISHLAGELNTKVRDVQAHASNSRLLYELAKKLNDLDSLEEQKQLFLNTMAAHLKVACNWQLTGSRQFIYLNEQQAEFGGIAFAKTLNAEQLALANTACSLLYQVQEKTLLREQSAAIKVQAELERSKNTLLRSLSHDLRTPLATIMGASSMLADDDIQLSSEVIKEQAANIYEQSKILNQHFDKVMELSKVNKLAENINWQKLPISTLVSEAKSRRQQQLQCFKLSIDAQPNSLCFGDETLLEIAFANMLENAARYGDGTASMQFIETHNEYQIVLINPFARKHETSQDEGVGLGSVICDVVAKCHQGRFELTLNEHTKQATAKLIWSNSRG